MINAVRETANTFDSSFNLKIVTYENTQKRIAC